MKEPDRNKQNGTIRSLLAKVVFLHQSLISRKMSKAEIHTAKGVMKVEFYDNDAPGTVANFHKLAKSGF